MKADLIDKYFHSKNILITGGAGFVGSHLAERISMPSNNVVSLDNYLSGRYSNHVENVSYIEGDVNNILEVFGTQKFDFIFHFGEYSRVEKSLEEPHVALSNTHKPFSTLLQFWASSSAKLVYSGSSTKFADGGLGRHLSPYTAAKSLNTELLIDFASWYQLPYSIVYFYNVYGGRELQEGKYATAIGKFKNLIARGETKLPVTLPGTQCRNFTHINDIIDGVLLAAVKGNGDGYGIGADQEYSILDVCEMFRCKPEFKEASSANRMGGQLKTEQIKKLGWQQKHFLPDHIAKFLNEN